jgi:hypothetical protein
MAMESSRLAATDTRAHNLAIIRQQHQQHHQLQSDHNTAKSTIAQLEDHIRIKSMELDGAKAQLQVYSGEGTAGLVQGERMEAGLGEIVTSCKDRLFVL